MEQQLDQTSKNMEKKQKNSRVSVTSLNVKEANFLLKRWRQVGGGGVEGEQQKTKVCYMEEICLKQCS